MEIKTRLAGNNLGPTIKKNMDRLGGVVREAAREAAEETAEFMEAAVADDIEAAGNFGERWQNIFHVDVHETQRTVWLDAVVRADEPPMSYWHVFEYGAHIVPKQAKYLWLPFRGAEGTDVWPRVYGYPDNLFYAESARGTPLLGDKESKEWKYFGLSEVTIPKKFHIHEIVKEEAAKAREAFKRILAEMMSAEK